MFLITGSALCHGIVDGWRLVCVAPLEAAAVPPLSVANASTSSIFLHDAFAVARPRGTGLNKLVGGNGA